MGLYGYDLNPKTNLSELLRNILKKTKIPRIRLSSLEVNEINDQIIETLQDKRVCPHLHVPLQSGDDNILRLMKRRYTTGKFLKTIERTIKKVKDIALGTDVIVGFPGEGEKEFKKTKDLIKSTPLSYLHIFPFSKRPNTEASIMKNQNAKHIKHERYVQLNALNIMKKNEYMKSYIDKTLDVIIEQRGEGNMVACTSSNYLKILVPTVTYNKGSLIRVRVVGFHNNKLIAYPL